MHKLKEFTPLLVIIGSILVAVAAWELYLGRFELMESMRLFMGLFFLTFGFFKALDWKGFAMAFAEYDVVASRSRFYAYLYPAIELVIGFLLLTNQFVFEALIAVAYFMAIGSVGVAKALFGKRKIHCACLGVVVKLPMTTITLIEDVGMGLMALYMLLSF